MIMEYNRLLNSRLYQYFVRANLGIMSQGGEAVDVRNIEGLEYWTVKFAKVALKIFEKDLSNKIDKPVLPIYERETMLQYSSEAESTRLLSVDEPIQIELECINQEIEV
jgi:hypothetical protein